MKKYFLIYCIAFVNIVVAQKLTKANYNLLQKQEEELTVYAQKMIMDEEAINRYRADSFFTRGLVKALKTPYSFYYNFDSVKTISKLYAPDSSFKIFTWQLMKDYSSYRQKGAIQINTSDGSLKLFPLFDASDDMENPVDSVRATNRWVGAIYYKIIQTSFNGKKYYTLLGLDENNEKSNKKWIDVLTFDMNGKPFFGGRYFQYPNDELKPKQPAFRFCLEYKKEARARLNFDEELDAIIFDHLISEEKDPAKRGTLIPDGDFEGFKWIDGRWVHVNKVFNTTVDMTGVDPIMGNPPVPKPIKDKKPTKKERKENELNNPYKISEDRNKKADQRKREEY